MIFLGFFLPSRGILTHLYSLPCLEACGFCLEIPSFSLQSFLDFIVKKILSGKFLHDVVCRPWLPPPSHYLYHDRDGELFLFFYERISSLDEIVGIVVTKDLDDGCVDVAIEEIVKNWCKCREL